MCDRRQTPVPTAPSGGGASRPSRPSGPSRAPRDKQEHTTTGFSDGSRAERRQTTIWVFRDPRKTKVSIYRGFEGLPWAIADLVRRTNLAIDRGEVPGQSLSVGDVVQACVVSYYDGEVRKPQTTADSPRYATLPYRLVRAPGGHVSAEPAIPPETSVHFKIPVTVGELIPGLDEDARREVLVTLQLKEAAHTSEQAIKESLEDAVRSREASYAVTEKADEEASAFIGFIVKEARREGAPAPPRSDGATSDAAEPDPSATPDAPDTDAPDTGARIRRRITESLQKRARDMEDFGFSDG
ncbi:MAG: hypothetical protein ACYTKD_11610 [Planctomycetota bacterium]|jgi:hypothetical protein